MNIGRFKLKKNQKRIANGFFFLLFPGFAIYNSFVAYGFIPAFLGGYFGVVSVFFIIFISPFILISCKELFLRDVDFSFLLAAFYFYIITWVLINYIFYSDYYVDLASIQSLELIILTLAMFFLGMSIDLDSQRFKKCNLFVFIVSAAMLIFYVATTGNVMFYAKSLAEQNDAISTYQGYARSAFVLCLAVLSTAKKQTNFLVLSVLSFLILFVLGARSELVATVFGIFVIYVSLFKFNLKSFFYVSVLCLALFTVVFFLYDMNSAGRQFQLLNVEDSSSWISREGLEDIALKQIAQSPILGIYGGHVSEGGSTGSYAHNILSAWAGFGFFGFLLYLMLFIYPMLSGFRAIYILRRVDSTVVFSFSLAVSCFLLVLFAKSFYWFVPGLMWGAFINSKRAID